MENRQAQVGANRGTITPMSIDLYSMAGLAAVTVAAGLIGLRMAKDEYLLRRKRLLTEKY